MALAAAAITLLTGATAGAAVSPNPWLQHRFLNIAHQGSEDEAPSDTVHVTFAPDGGDPDTQSAGVKLIKRR